MSGAVEIGLIGEFGARGRALVPCFATRAGEPVEYARERSPWRPIEAVTAPDAGELVNVAPASGTAARGAADPVSRNRPRGGGGYWP